MRPPLEHPASFHQRSPDRALVEQLTADDDHAYHELLARYRSMVYAIAYAVLVDPEGAEAVVAQTFREARRTAAAFLKAPGSVPKWLTDLAHACVGNGHGSRAR
jgi:DNA-directed RNA polymerase specialized sigma24 family protein